MKFNSKELAAYGASRIGHADKEGSLWMKESDGIVKKKENYNKRWCLLCGNLLFYTKEESHDSPLLGVLILERAQVESEAFSGNRNAFRITFQNNGGSYWFYADSARDADEWIRLLNSASFEYLRIQFSELRGQIMHLTGKDPFASFGYEGIDSQWSNVSPTLLTSAPGYDGQPVFELLLSCSSLVGPVTDSVPPSPLIVTNCMTPPQAYWIRYAQTELVERNCDPQFLTPVIFFEGSIFTATQLKFDIYDVCNQSNGLMRPLGQCQCTIQELIREPEKLHRFEILYDDTISGYLLIKTKMNFHHTPNLDDEHQVTSVTHDSPEPVPPQISSFSFRSPIDNIVVRPFQFPKQNDSFSVLTVTEVMGESLFTFTIPMQILEMCISEEHVTIGQFGSLTGLSEHWEIVRQEVCLELRHLTDHYSKSLETVQTTSELGKFYKRSTDKDSSVLEFVPVNLHVQEMKVSTSSDEKERTLYSCVTVGCPSAYSLKYRQGGLARMQAATPTLGGSASFSPATENKTFRVKQLLRRFSQQQVKIKKASEELTQAAEKGDHDRLKTGVRSVVDCVATLENHCTVQLVKDALRDWYKALDINKIPPFIKGLTSLDPKSVLSIVEQHMVCVEAQVEGVVSSKLTPAECSSHLMVPISDLLLAIDQAIDIFQTALFFILLREHYSLQVNKIPIGLKGSRHRRDIVFSQTVTTATTSFVMKVLRSIGSKYFLTQLQDLGFLIHWESLLSTQGDEIGMLEDFLIAIHDLNALKFKFVLANSVNDLPRCNGSRYKAVVDIPVQHAIFRILPSPLREGKEIQITAVLFTQGINEQQSIADTFGDSHIQDQINAKSYQRLSTYTDKFYSRFGTVGLTMSQRAKTAKDLLVQLRSQINARKTKNTDILTLSAELCRHLDCGRITSCKSAKDRTAMSVTLEQAHILLQQGMETTHFQQALDSMRSQGTRIRNAEKNLGVPLYAFNALQVVALPKNYRPPEGTYKKLQT